jgi:hypothetical protein
MGTVIKTFDMLRADVAAQWARIHRSPIRFSALRDNAAAAVEWPGIKHPAHIIVKMVGEPHVRRDVHIRDKTVFGISDAPVKRDVIWLYCIKDALTPGEAKIYGLVVVPDTSKKEGVPNRLTGFAHGIVDNSRILGSVGLDCLHSVTSTNNMLDLLLLRPTGKTKKSFHTAVEINNGGRYEDTLTHIAEARSLIMELFGSSIRDNLIHLTLMQIVGLLDEHLPYNMRR